MVKLYFAAEIQMFRDRSDCFLRFLVYLLVRFNWRNWCRCQLRHVTHLINGKQTEVFHGLWVDAGCMTIKS